MGVLDRALPIVLGLVLLSASAHVNIQYMGGYDSPQAIMLIAAIVGLGGGAVFVSRAEAQGRYLISAMMLVALICGEAYALLSTADRVVSSRQQQQGPLRLAEQRRDMASAQLENAELALASTKYSPRLERALAAQEAAAAAVISESSKRTCSRTCIAALEQRATEATAEVNAARVELQKAKAIAQREVAEARAILISAAVSRQADTLAKILGWQAWAIGLTAAALASISVNILGALFIAFGAHRSHSVGSSKVTEPGLSLDKQVKLFMADCLTGSHDTPTPVAEIAEAYVAWTQANNIELLPLRAVCTHLSVQFDQAGIPVTDIDGTRVAIGVTLRSQERAKIA